MSNNNYNTTINVTSAVQATRRNCAALAEQLLALGRADEIPRLILAGVAPDRIPPAPGAQNRSDPISLGGRAAAGPGFDPEASAERFRQQTARRDAAPA